MTETAGREGRLVNAIRNGQPSIFWAFVGLHLVVWTLVPTHFHPALPMDVIEGLTWVQDWAFGYYKHPPLTAWVLGLWQSIAGTQVWTYYLLAQLTTAIAFWAIWRLGREFLSPARALIAVVLLEGVFFYNFESTDFNPNTTQLPLWPLIALLFYRAIKSGNLLTWAILGVAAAATILTKYSAGILLLPLTLFMFFEPDARTHWRTPGPYITGVVTLIILAPHISWLFASDFTTIEYALGRAGEAPAAIKHLTHPLRFLLGQIGTLLPVIILAAILVAGRPWERVSRRDWQFEHRLVLVLLFGPALTYFLLSAGFGFKIRTLWAAPLWPMIGIAAMLFFEPKLTLPRVRWFARGWGIVFALILVAYSTMLGVAPLVSREPSRGHFAGPELAAQITERWQKQFNRPLPFVIGRTWLAGTVALHSTDQPMVLIEGRADRSPGVVIEDVLRSGGVIVWDAKTYGSASTPDHLMRLFRAERKDVEVTAQPELSLAWQRPFPVPGPNAGGPPALTPQRIGWAILPPAKTSN